MSSVKVVVRLRPPSSEEGVSIINMDKSTTTVSNLKKNGGDSKTFSFDNCFKNASQQSLYDDIGVDLLNHAFDGFNTCLFAYGQTASGKTYSMMGRLDCLDSALAGIIPRFSSNLFERISSNTENNSLKFNVQVFDLLNPSTQNEKLRIREHPTLGPYVEDLSKSCVSNVDQLLTLISEGNKSRTVASTNMNLKSSRSHSIFTIYLSQRYENPETDEIISEKQSRICLVDLAGSERQKSTGASGKRLKEGSNINKSLTTLGKALTWLLKDNLGGNSKTTMLANISPSEVHYEETLSTLRYAERAKRIVNVAIVNEDAGIKALRELREEVSRLRMQVDNFKQRDDSNGDENGAVVVGLRERLIESEKIMKEMAKSFEEKLAESRNLEMEREKVLSKMGIDLSSKVFTPPTSPYLLNLNEDPALSECLLYMLNESGDTFVTNPSSESYESLDFFHHTIEISAPHIQSHHCTFNTTREDDEYKVILTPSSPTSKIFVNGSKITSHTYLLHGDRLVFGSHHFFHFKSPSTSLQTQSRRDSLISQSETLRESSARYSECWNVAMEEMQHLRLLRGSKSQYSLMNGFRECEFEEESSYYGGSAYDDVGDFSFENSRVLRRSMENSMSAENILDGLWKSDLKERNWPLIRKQVLAKMIEVRSSDISEIVVENISLLKKANIISVENQKTVAYQFCLGYFNEITKDGICVKVQVLDGRHNANYVWSLEEFKTRVSKMKTAFNYSETPSVFVDQKINLDYELFYNPIDKQEKFIRIGTAGLIITEQPNSKDNQLIVFDFEGVEIGELKVVFDRCIGNEKAEISILKIITKPEKSIEFTDFHVRFSDSTGQLYSTERRNLIIDKLSNTTVFEFKEIISISTDPKFVFEVCAYPAKPISHQIDAMFSPDSHLRLPAIENTKPHAKNSSSQNFDILAKLQILEMSPTTGKFQPSKFKSNCQKTGSFYLKPGVQRRISIKLSHTASREFPFVQFKTVKIGNIRYQINNKIELTKDTTKKIDLKVPSSERQLLYTFPDGRTAVYCSVPWDSSLHENICLNKNTQAGGTVVMGLEFEVEIGPINASDGGFKLLKKDVKFEMDFNVFIGNENRVDSVLEGGGRLMGLLSSFGIVSPRVFTSFSTIFTVAVENIDRKLGDNRNLGVSNYVRGEECLYNFDFNGISLENFIIQNRRLKWRREVEISRQVIEEWEYSSDLIKRKPKNNDDLIKRILDIWKKSSTNPTSKTCGGMVGVDSNPPSFLYANSKQIFLTAHVSASGWMATLNENGHWTKKYVVVQRPFLHVYEDSGENEQVMAINLKEITVQYSKDLWEELNRPFTFAVYTKYYSTLFQATSENEMEYWVSTIDPLSYSVSLQK